MVEGEQTSGPALARQDTRPRQRRTNHPGIYPFPCRRCHKTCYRIEYRSGGRQVWETCHGTLRDAVAQQAKGRSEGAQTVRSSSRTVADVMNVYLARHGNFVGLSTIEGYRNSWDLVADTLGPIPLRGLTAELIQDTLLDLLHPTAERPAYAYKTVLHARALLGQALGDAVAKRILPFNPMAGRAVRLPRTPDNPRAFLETADMLRAHAVLASDETADLLLALGAFIGLRRGEVAALRRWGVDVDSRTVTVSRAFGRSSAGEYEKAPKSVAGSRTVPIPERVTEILARFASGDPTDYLVPTPRGVNVRVDYLTRRWTSIVAYKLMPAGVPRVSYHGLRHSYATMLAEAGISGILHMRVMGHAAPLWGMGPSSAVDPDLLEPVGSEQPRYIHQTRAQIEHARLRIDRYLDEVAREAGLE